MPGAPSSSTWSTAICASRGCGVTFVKNFTDVDDKIIKRANDEGRARDRRLRAVHRRVPDGHGVDRRAARGRRAKGHRAHPRDGRADRATDREWRGLCRGRRRLLRGPAIPGLRRLVGQEHRGPRGGGPCRRGRAQARPARLRAVEGGEAGRARVAEPVGAGPAGLAHRVLGHGDALSGRELRPPRRRRGSHLSRTTRTRSPSPRRRRRARSCAAGCTTDSSIWDRRRCRSRSAIRSRSGTWCGVTTPRPFASISSGRTTDIPSSSATSASPRPRGRSGGSPRSRRRRGGLPPREAHSRPEWTAGSPTRSRPSAPGSRRRWTTTSIRRRRSACSSIWPGF